MEVTLNDLDENGDSVDEEYYIKKAVRRAYRDASSHVLSIKEGKDDSKKNPCKKEEAISAVVYEVKSINNDYNNYECWHSHVCKDLTERIYNTYEVDYKGDDRTFSYGIAQKFVNMTIKYLVILYTVMKAMDTDKANRNYIKFYEKNLKKYEQDFHIPIDGYILESVSKDKAEILKNVIVKEKKKVKAWSKWEENDYNSFQAELKKIKAKDEYPLDWEGKTWIEIAKSRKEKIIYKKLTHST